jgi:dTDP-4-amino-4,6-dideoxygalactose transaminase
VIRTEKRQELMGYLNTHDIQAGIHYPIPVHMQPAYKDRVRTASNMGVTQRLADEVLSLPMYPELLSSEVARVIEVVNGFFIKSVSA